MVDAAQDLYKDQAGHTSQNEWGWAREVPSKAKELQGIDGCKQKIHLFS